MSSTHSNKDQPNLLPITTGEEIISITPILPDFVFGAAHLNAVAGFHCNKPGQSETQWEKDVSDWIKAPRGANGAIDAIEYARAQVWLYFKEQRGEDEPCLIGYGSIGYETLKTESGRNKEVCIIPFFGIASEYRGKPDGPRNGHYARRIFQGLIDTVRQRKERVLYLYVDPNNPVRHSFYPTFGFEELRIDPPDEDGREWVVMRKKL